MPQFVPQFALEDLAERVARQLIPDFEPLGQLERGDALLPQVRHDFLQRHGRLRAGHHDGAGPLDKLQIADPIYAPR